MFVGKEILDSIIDMKINIKGSRTSALPNCNVRVGTFDEFIIEK